MARLMFRGGLRREGDNQNSESECESFHRMTSFMRLRYRNARALGPIHYVKVIRGTLKVHPRFASTEPLPKLYNHASVVIRYVLRNYWITLKAHRPQARDDLARAEERHRAAGMSPRSPISAEVG